MQAAITPAEKRFVHTMQLLGDSTRYQIFKLLASGQEMCVTEIATSIDVSPSAVSQHFRNFEMLDLVDRKRNGQKICYSLRKDDELVKKLRKIQGV